VQEVPGAILMKSDTLKTKTKTKTTCLVFVGQGIVSPYIGEDIILALKSLGCAVELQPLVLNMQLMEQKIEAFKPQIIIAIDGKGLHFPPIKEWSCKRVAWFVDNPYYFSETNELEKDDFLFIWDKEYIPDLKGAGFKNVFFLPLATNPERFSDQPLSEQEQKQYACDVSFVGSIGKERDSLREEHREKYPPAVNRLVDKLFTLIKYLYEPKKSREVLGMLQQVRGMLDAEIRPLVDHLLDKEVDAYWRHGVLQAIQSFDAKLYGPEALEQYSGERTSYIGEAGYQEEVRKIYKASQVNINATRPQLRMTINQRIFDVFSCGGFLLTDYRTFLEEVLPFDPRQICYNSFDDLKERVSYYLTNPKEKEGIIEAAKQSIRQNHTYESRMREMLGILGL